MLTTISVNKLNSSVACTLLAHLAEGQLSLWDGAAFVVRPSTFPLNDFFSKPLD